MKKEEIGELTKRGKHFNNPFAKKWKEKLEGIARHKALKDLTKKV